ncbi:MAG: class I SAM-dependent methyltransferase, partial [Candidatus Berkiella sp.]
IQVWHGSILMNINTNHGSQSYALATGELGAPRLHVQNTILGKFSEDLLAKAGLAKGMTVIDLACGSGAMTSYLAHSVGPQGHVFAVDISEAQLAVAKKYVESENLRNVSFIQGDIMDLQTLPTQKVDIVYARFILMHLKDPKSAINNMKSLLKIGGKIVSEETTKSTTYSGYKTALFAEYIESLVKLGNSLGVDYNIGEKLAKFYQMNEFSNLEYFFQKVPMTALDAKTMFSLSLGELQSKLLAANLTTLDKVDTWKETFENIPLDNPSFEFRLSDQAYVIAQK